MLDDDGHGGGSSDDTLADLGKDTEGSERDLTRPAPH